MPTNSHTFEQGETFNGRLDDETIEIREASKHTVVWDYIVSGETIGRNTIEKERARTFIKCGQWTEPITE